MCSAQAQIKASVDPFEVVEYCVENFDRPPESSSTGTYAMSGDYTNSGGKNAPGQRIPKAGVFAGAGVGKAEAHIGVLAAEANGPNASAGASASALTGVSAMACAEIASASAQAGPLKAKIGIGVDTGARIGPMGVEIKFLGTGIKIGPETSVSLLGSEISCSIQ